MPSDAQVSAVLDHLSAEFDAAEQAALSSSHGFWNKDAGPALAQSIRDSKANELRALRAAAPEQFEQAAIATEKRLRNLAGYSQEATVQSVLAGNAEPDWYAGGDPVMGAIGVGHDYAETVAASAAVDRAEEAKGKPLTEAERQQVLSAYPSADAGIATRVVYRGARDAALYLADLPKKLLGLIPWWVWVGGGLVVVGVGFYYVSPLLRFIPKRAGE